MNRMIKRVLTILMWACVFNLGAENQINYNPRMTQYLMTLGEEKFVLFDVGASAGISDYWKFFGKNLCGVGFDPLVNECDRLNAINQIPGFVYVSGYIISEINEIDQNKGYTCLDFCARSSSHFYLNNFNINYAKEYFNAGSEIVYSKNMISLDRYCLENKINNVDFIKVDTDGFDYGVLRGAEKLLKDGNVLGLYVESQFQGEANPYSNTFRNIDYFLVENGFSLFDLSTWRYTRAQLPGKFLYTIPAQTVTGQVYWGDALYLKDFIRMKTQGKQIPNSQIIKMACLQEIFGLPDCAAELLITFRDQLSQCIDVDKCLNALACDMELYQDYDKHIEKFYSDREAFFPK